jgi:hypothetical protein
MSDHTACRLTTDDRARITAAVAHYAKRSAGVLASERFTTAERIAHHAIGCTAADLRDVEVDDIAALVRRLQATPTP